MLAVHFTTDVNPVTQDYLNRQLDQAAKDGYDAAVIVLDTPGGLSESMRKIVQKELALEDPGDRLRRARRRARRLGRRLDRPGGRRARDGAGDEHRLVDADRLGSGENIGSDLRRKVVNDAAASLRALAKSTAATPTWADAAVRKASNLTAQEALQRTSSTWSRRRCRRC